MYYFHVILIFLVHCPFESKAVIDDIPDIMEITAHITRNIFGIKLQKELTKLKLEFPFMKHKQHIVSGKTNFIKQLDKIPDKV